MAQVSWQWIITLRTRVHFIMTVGKNFLVSVLGVEVQSDRPPPSPGVFSHNLLFWGYWAKETIFNQTRNSWQTEKKKNYRYLFHLSTWLLKEKYCTQASRDPPSSQGIKGGEGVWRKGKIRPIEVTEHSPFYCSQNNWCPTIAHTLTSFLLPWYFQSVAWKTFSLYSAITCCQIS